MVAPYFCSSFHIFDRPILEEYVSQVEGGPHLLQSCLHPTWNVFPPATKKMHPSFESLIVTNALGLQASLMDIHRDTTFRYILKDDSILSTSKARIRFCSSKRARLWLIAKPFIHSFCIAHFIFTSMLCFHLGLILPSVSNLLMCECGHGLDTSNIDLVHCQGQHITTHDTIWNVMYALVQEMGMLYGESDGTPLCQEFHYELIFTWPKKSRSSLLMWWLST
jgi:hypothetical protein